MGIQVVDRVHARVFGTHRVVGLRLEQVNRDRQVASLRELTHFRHPLRGQRTRVRYRDRHVDAGTGNVAHHLIRMCENISEWLHEPRIEAPLPRLVRPVCGSASKHGSNSGVVQRPDHGIVNLAGRVRPHVFDQGRRTAAQCLQRGCDRCRVCALRRDLNRLFCDRE